MILQDVDYTCQTMLILNMILWLYRMVSILLFIGIWLYGMKPTPTISLQYSGIQPSLESLQMYKTVSKKTELMLQ